MREYELEMVGDQIGTLNTPFLPNCKFRVKLRVQLHPKFVGLAEISKHGQERPVFIEDDDSMAGKAEVMLAQFFRGNAAFLHPVGTSIQKRLEVFECSTRAKKDVLISSSAALRPNRLAESNCCRCAKVEIWR